MKKMYQKRLLRLAEFLEGLRPEEFNLARWVTRLRGDEYCHTVACAAGYAGMLPEFNEMGFHLEGQDPFYKEVYGFSACSMFFGITRDEVVRLFLSSSYPGGTKTRPTTVAKRLRSCVAKATLRLRLSPEAK